MPILTGAPVRDARGRRSDCADAGSVTRARTQPALRSHVKIPLRRGLRPGARRARLAWALKPHNKQKRDEPKQVPRDEPKQEPRDEPVKMNNERMLVRDANTGEMMEMCLKTGILLKLGSPPSEDMKFPASALRHKKPVPAHLRPKEVAPIVVTAPPPAAPPLPAPPADATPPPLPARVAAPTPPPPPSSDRRRRRCPSRRWRRRRRSRHEHQRGSAAAPF